MKLSDMAKVQTLERTVSNCDFHLAAMYPGSPIRIWNGDKGHIHDSYGEKYLSPGALESIHSIIVNEITTRRAEAVEALKQLGVEV